MKSKLDETRNFIDLCVYAAGDWKTPVIFHRWAAIALIAASVEDRVWLSIFDHSPLKPNIWVFLIGPSGSGKDHAIGHALSLLRPEDDLIRVDGKVTMPALYDFMATSQKLRESASIPVWLISSDVTEQLPVGPEAKDFTSRALALYGGRDRDLLDLTRMHGHKIVRNPLMNWIGGCTPEWFPNAIDPQVFGSGFTGRAFFVIGEPDYRYFHMMKPIEHHDKAKIMDFLRTRVERFLSLEGMFVVSNNARTVYDQWLRYIGEQAQRQNLNDVERQVYGRIKTSVEKLAMIFALADWKDGDLLIIKAKHMRDAILEAEWLLKNAQVIANYAFSTVESQAFDAVSDAIRHEGEINRSRLMGIATRRGVRDHKHLDAIVETLRQMGQITIDTNRRGKTKGGPRPTWYKWVTRKLQFKEDDLDAQLAQVVAATASAGTERLEAAGNSHSPNARGNRNRAKDTGRVANRPGKSPGRSRTPRVSEISGELEIPRDDEE